MDGSAGPFVYLLQSAGIQEQSAAKQFIRVTRDITVQDGDKSATLRPYDGFRVTFAIDFDHPVFKEQVGYAALDLAPRRSCVRSVVPEPFSCTNSNMRSRGLAHGGSVDNAIVIDDYRILNDGGLRFDDEFVKHKMLDAIGDLYLAGHQLLVEYEGVKSGHALNNRLVRALFDNPDHWEWVTFDDPADSLDWAFRVRSN